jgi:aspartokinase-like uncharacterized kinase
MKDEFGGRRSEVPRENRGRAAGSNSSFILHPSSFAARIVKFGGSLLTWAEWPSAFRRWLATQPQRRTVLIVGGGGLVDGVRDWDRAHRLNPSDAHWLAIDAMSLTSRLAAHLLPEAHWTDDWATVGVLPLGGAPPPKGRTPTRVLIFDPRPFLQATEPITAGGPLPQSWDVTSDSIAARIAGLLGSDELVLLKSCLPDPPVATLEAAATAGFVDRGFPTFAPKLPLVRLVNLRGGTFPEVRFEQAVSASVKGQETQNERASACDHSTLTTHPSVR